MEESGNYYANPNVYCKHCGGLIDGVYTGEMTICRCKIKKDIETAIRSTLVIGNSESIYIAVEKIMEIINLK